MRFRLNAPSPSAKGCIAFFKGKFSSFNSVLLPAYVVFYVLLCHEIKAYFAS